MASIKLAGDTSGEITIQAPAVAGTTTLTLPANTGTVITSATAAADVPSPTKLSTASGSAPSYSARAWVNFQGNGTVAIRDSGNVSSITDNGSGDYTVNFTTAMPDTNYCMVAGPSHTNDTDQAAFSVRSYDGAITTTSIDIISSYSNSSAYSKFDMQTICVAIFT